MSEKYMFDESGHIGQSLPSGGSTREDESVQSDARGRKNGPSLKLKVAFGVLSLAISFFALEIAIRGYDEMVGRGFFSNTRNLITRAKEPPLPFRTFGFNAYEVKDGERFISSRHEELYPIEKTDGAYRVVVFGGSTTENKKAVESGGPHYPLKLQSDLRQRLGRDNIEVINVGNSAYATPHTLILLEHDALSWDPDLVIISHNANDRSAQYWPEFTFDYSNKYSDPFYSGGNLRSSFTLVNAVFQHSQLYWFLRSKADRFLKRDAMAVKRKSYGMEPSPAAVEVFKRNLRSFATLASSNGIQVLFATQPYQIKGTTLNVKPYNEYVLWPLDEELEAHHAYYNDAIKDVAKETGAWYLDNAQVMSGRDDYFFDAVHYTALGVDRLARSYADFLIANQIVE